MPSKLLFITLLVGLALFETAWAIQFSVSHVHEVSTDKVVEIKPPPPPIFRKEKPKYTESDYRKAKLRLANDASLRSKSGHRDAFLSELKILHSEPRPWNVAFKNLDHNLILRDHELIVEVDDHVLPDEGHVELFLDDTPVGKAYSNTVHVSWWGGSEWPAGVHTVKAVVYYKPRKQLCPEKADGTPNLNNCVPLNIPAQPACEREVKFYVHDKDATSRR